MNIGDLAPGFDVQTDTGALFSLSNVRGRWVVLWFFPESESLITDLQVAGFKKLTEAFLELSIVVVGVSTESREAHIQLRARHHMTFPLCTDRSKAISKVYGVLAGLNAWRGLANRKTFLIAPDGKIAHVWSRIRPRNHAQEVLELTEKLEIERRIRHVQVRRGLPKAALASNRF